MAECISQFSLPCSMLWSHRMEIGVLGGVGWSTPPSTLCGGGWMGLGAGPDGYKKNHIPTGIWTPDHSAYRKSLCHIHCHTHQEHNDVNVNDKISDFHGVHFLVSYTMWWLNNTVFWKDVLPTLSELWLAKLTQTFCINDIFCSIPSFCCLPEPVVTLKMETVHSSEANITISVFSKVSGQVGSSVRSVRRNPLCLCLQV
jgi:hypothetical protein